MLPLHSFWNELQTVRFRSSLTGLCLCSDILPCVAAQLGKVIHFWLAVLCTVLQSHCGSAIGHIIICYLLSLWYHVTVAKTSWRAPVSMSHKVFLNLAGTVTFANVRGPFSEARTKPAPLHQWQASHQHSHLYRADDTLTFMSTFSEDALFGS